MNHLIARLERFLEERKISFTDLWTYLDCPLAFLYRKLRLQRLENPSSRVGNVVHNRAECGGNTAEARIYQERQLGRLDDSQRFAEDGTPIPSERQQAVAEVEQLAAVDEKLDAADESTDKKNEELYAFHDTNWWFPEWAAKELPADLAAYDGPTGWTFFSKLDQKSIIDGGKTQVLERKKGYAMHDKYREQLFYSGMVLLLGRHVTGSMRLVVRLLKGGRDVEFWYKASKRWEQLARWRKVVGEIVKAMDREIVKMRTTVEVEQSGEAPTAEQEAILAQVNFPARDVADGEWPCRECPWRHICPAKKQAQKVAAAAQAAEEASASDAAGDDDNLVRLPIRRELPVALPVAM